MDHMMKPGVLMPSPNLSAVSNIGNNRSSSHHHHHHHRMNVTGAGVGVLSPVASSSSSSAPDRCRCTLCNYVGLDDNDLHRHFREIHWQQVLIMHQQRQEILNGAVKSNVKSPPTQKYASADQPSSTSYNMLTSSTDSNNIELDESIVAAANTILSISASNNAAMQNQRRYTMNDCSPVAAKAMPSNLTNGVYHHGSKDQMIRQADLPSSEESQLLRKMQQQHPQNLAAIAELAEYSSQAQQPQQVNSFSLELLLQQQQLLLSQQNELNPLRLAALAELRAVLASQLYATLQQQQQQPIATSATAQQTFLSLNQQQQNAASIASAQNFWPQHLPHQANGGGSGAGDTMIDNAVAAVGHQNVSNALRNDLQNSLQQHIREQQLQQQPYPSSRRHSIIAAVNTTSIRPSVSQSNICHQGRSENQISTTTPVTINTYVAAISTAPPSASVAAPASLTLRSPEEITQHISRIISENEAILEPSPILTKRRYTRQLNGPITVQQPQQSGNNTNLSSPNTNGPREYRSNSLYSSFSPASIQRQNSFGGGGGPVAFCRPNVVKLDQQSPIAMNACSSTTLSPSYTNVPVNSRGSCASDTTATAAVDNTALTFLTQVENATFRASGKLYVCKFCCLNVRHYDDLKRHEEKCAKREDAARNPASLQAVTPANSKIPFKKQLLIRSGQDTGHCDQVSDVKNEGTLEPLPSKHRCLQPVIESHGSLVQKKHLTLPSILIPACSSNNNISLLSPPLKINNDAKNLPPTATIHLQPYTLTLKSVTSTAMLDSAANLSGAVAFSPFSAQDRRKALMTERWCFKSSPIAHHFICADPKSSLAHYDAKIPVRAKDSLQNLQWMRSFNLRWRHSFLRYSLAKPRDSMLVTHSTYWKYAQQQLQLQQIQPKSARKHCQENSPRSETQNTTLRAPAKKPKIEQTPLISLSHQRSSLIDAPSRRSSQMESDSIVRSCCESETAATSVSFSPSDDLKNATQHGSQNQEHRVLQGCSKRNSEDSDETMSNDGLCVVTDDEDEKCQPGQKTSLLIRELRQGLLNFSRIWTRLLEDRSNERLICQTPAFSDHHTVDFQHSNHDLIRCSSAPPVFFGQLPSAFVDHSMAINRKLVLDSRTNHSSISSTSGSSFSAQDCLSEGLKGSYFNASVTGDTDGMEVIADSGISDISTPSDSRITPISTGGTSCNVCEFCGQKFEKFSLFVLHRSVHSINRNAHKRYEYRCPYCSSNQRSRNLLQRHIATAHQRLCSQYANSSTSRGENEAAVNGNKVLLATTTSNDHQSTISADNRTIFNSGQQQQQTSSQRAFNNGVTSRINNQPLLNDPRPFKCHYCEIAFRIHGHLAKHLRSKAHVMKLEALSLVPPGALSVLEEGDRLSQIDTSDCENSLRSLLKLMEKFNNGNNAPKKKTSQTAAPIPPMPDMLSPSNTADNNTNDAFHQPSVDQNWQPVSDLLSLACTESFSVATSPLQDATEKSADCGSKRSITASGVWMPPKDVSLPITVPVSPVDSCYGGDQTVNSTVINNGHLGSMPTISSQVLDVQTSVLTPRPRVDAPAHLAFPCCICDGRFYSQLDLDVHYHADHVVMRDGSFFKCPAKDCDTVYPTRLNLRNHLILHYTGRLPCTANNSGFVSSPGENGNGCSTAAAAAAPSTPEATTNSSYLSMVAATDRTDVSRSTVAALNRKLLSGHGDTGDSNGLNGSGSRKVHCSRSSSTKSHCDCQKCIKQQADNIDNSPPPDSDASRLSASSRSHSPTPPSRPASKRSLMTTPASFSSSSINNLQMSGGNGAATSSTVYNDSVTLMSAFGGGAAKRVKYVSGFYGHQHPQQQAHLADFAHHSGLQAASPNSFLAAPGAFQATVRSITAHQPQAQSPYNLVNVNQLAALNSAISPPTASILAFQQQQLAALKSFYSSWGGAVLPQSILNAAAVAAAGAASFPPTPHVLAHHPPINASTATAASAPVFSLDNLRCIKCTKQFYSPMAVQQHIIAEHSEAVPRAHVCPFCDAAFTTQHALQTHMPCKMQSLSHQ